MKEVLQFIKKINFNWLLVFVSIAALFLAFFVARNQQVWFDESYSIWITKGHSFTETISLTSVDAHPPFYYILLKIWGDIGSWNLFWLRVLSILFFGLSIFAAGKFTQRIFGKKVALYSVVLLTLSPLLLRYSYEIRMYSLASLITILSTWAFFELFENPKNKKIWIAYGILVSLGMWTLYTLALVFLSHFVIAVFMQIKRRGWRIWKETWFKSYALSIVLWLPWLPSFLYQLKNSASSGIGNYIDFKQIENAFDFLFFYKPQHEIVPFFAIIGFGLIVWLIYRSVKYFDNSKILYYSAILPFVITLVLSQPIWLKKPFFVERYMSQFAILLYLILAISVVKFIQNNHRLKSLALGAVLILALSVGAINVEKTGNFNYQNYRMSNAGDNMNILAKYCGKKPIIMSDVYLFMELEIYNYGRCDLRIVTSESDYGGGYAPVNTFAKRIKGEKNLSNLSSFVAATAKDKPAEFATKNGFKESNDFVPKFDNLSVYSFKQ